MKKQRNPTKRKIQNKGYSEAGASYVKKSMKAMIPNSGAPSEDIDNNNPAAACQNAVYGFRHCRQRHQNQPYQCGWQWAEAEKHHQPSYPWFVTGGSGSMAEADRSGI